MKTKEYYDQFIKTVPDFPIKGIMFKDIVPTLEDNEAFQNVINDLASLLEGYNYDKIVCADARGFLFGAPLAYKLNKGLVIARKPNKLPRPGLRYSYTLEYAENELILSKDTLKEGEKVAIIDDLLATGGSACAMLDLIKQAKAIPQVIAFYIELPDLKGKEAIQKEASIPVKSIITYEGL